MVWGSLKRLEQTLPAPRLTFLTLAALGSERLPYFDRRPIILVYKPNYTCCNFHAFKGCLVLRSTSLLFSLF